MKIIEQFIEGKKRDPAQCEDGIVVCDDFIAVADGATNKSDFNFAGKTPGRVAMELVCEAVKRLAADADAVSAVKAVNAHIAEFYRREGLSEKMRASSEARCTASAVIYSRARRELWFAGDCQAYANDTAIQPQKAADRVFADLRALLINTELASGRTEKELLEHDTARDAIVPLLRRQTRLQNCRIESDFSYNVIDGFDWPDYERGLRIIKVESDEVALASDGYPVPFPTLEQTEAYLKRVLAEDPLCYRLYRSTKGVAAGNASYDDRAYIRFYT